jgi:hypothetical protein
MLDVFLVPETAVEADGESASVEIGSGAGKFLVLTLAITKIAEQQSLDVGIWGSVDGADWGANPLKVFPQKFYRGVYEILLDLSGRPDVRFLKAKWHVNRWGVGDTKPRFTFLVKAEEHAGRGAMV